MRVVIAVLAGACLLAGCEKAGEAGVATAPGEGMAAQVDAATPYAGEWASASGDCDDDRKLWTIEARRMAIVPAMRFCAFDKVYVSDADQGDSVWSAAAQCLADGRESQDFVFFRLDDNLRQMRVTFNDTRSVDLVRCNRS